jgi:aerobic carbon-monoxide dehydrogenase medium subunit
VSLPAFAYREPDTLEEVVALLAEGGDEVRLLGGGTALVLLMRARLLRPRLVVSLGRIAGLARIVVNGDVRIGATVTHRQVERSAELRRLAPLLATACGHVGSPAIRAMGTLGGNLAYGEAASDPAPALLALDARITVEGPAGSRTLALETFFRGLYETDLREGEVVTAVHVPRPPATARSTFVKYTCLSEEERAVVSVAALVVPGADGTWADVRLGLGAVGPTPLRARAAEGLIRGRAPTPAAIREVAEAAAEATDPLGDRQGSAEYRRTMTRVWVRRALERLAAPTGGSAPGRGEAVR